jgi:predicted AAA+ superfamily ATPase
LKMPKTELQDSLLGFQLPGDVEAYLRDTCNPWWEDKPMRVLPLYHRHLFQTALQRLKSGLAPVLVLRGPRQVGKTTLQEQTIYHLLHNEKINPKRIFRVQFDEIPSLKGHQDPILSICRWYENRILGGTFNEWAHNNTPIYIFFDEVQNLPAWAPQVKALVDGNTVRVFLTGSSSLRIERGRDSLAGRISSLEFSTLLLREIAAIRGWGEIEPVVELNGLTALKTLEFWKKLRYNGKQNQIIRDKAFEAYSERGGYPIAQTRPDRPWEELADQLNETIIRRVIQHDLRLGAKGRKRDDILLEEVFRLACRYAGQRVGQPVFVNDIHNALKANISWEKINIYLKFLNETLLIRLIDPLEIRIKKRKSSAKICLCDHSLRASWLQESIPLTPEGLRKSPHLSDLAGHLAESVAGYFLGSIPGLDVAWFPERGAEPEVDFILTIGEQRIPMEIKYQQRIDGHRDTLGLRSFIEKSVYNAPFGILVTLHDDVEVLDPRIVALPLSSLLLMR